MKRMSFAMTDAESTAIQKIVERGEALTRRLGYPMADRLHVTMDLAAANANGCPMDFDRMLAADDANFAHDFGGIRRHLNRETGELEDCFLPRFAKREGGFA